MTGRRQQRSSANHWCLALTVLALGALCDTALAVEDDKPGVPNPKVETNCDLLPQCEDECNVVKWSTVPKGGECPTLVTKEGSLAVYVTNCIEFTTFSFRLVDASGEFVPIENVVDTVAEPLIVQSDGFPVGFIIAQFPEGLSQSPSKGALLLVFWLPKEYANTEVFIVDVNTVNKGTLLDSIVFDCSPSIPIPIPIPMFEQPVPGTPAIPSLPMPVEVASPAPTPEASPSPTPTPEPSPDQAPAPAPTVNIPFPSTPGAPAVPIPAIPTPDTIPMPVPNQAPAPTPQPAMVPSQVPLPLPVPLMQPQPLDPPVAATPAPSPASSPTPSPQDMPTPSTPGIPSVPMPLPQPDTDVCPLDCSGAVLQQDFGTENFLLTSEDVEFIVSKFLSHDPMIGEECDLLSIADGNGDGKITVADINGFNTLVFASDKPQETLPTNFKEIFSKCQNNDAQGKTFVGIDGCPSVSTKLFDF